MIPRQDTELEKRYMALCLEAERAAGAAARAAYALHSGGLEGLRECQDALDRAHVLLGMAQWRLGRLEETMAIEGTTKRGISVANDSDGNLTLTPKKGQANV